MRGASTATRTSRRCTSISCRRRTSRAIPSLLRTRGSYERLADDDNGLNTVWPVRPNPGTNRAYQAGIDRADGIAREVHRRSARRSCIAAIGCRADLYGNVFVAEPAANLVSRIVLTDDGATLQARKAYEQGEFLASTDERFRPVYLSNAPDGTLYVVDMYRGIIEHRLSLTVYLRDHILERKLEQPTGFGRIYRVVHDTTRRDTRTTLSQASPAQLVDMLSDPNGWWRDTAQRLLVERRTPRAGRVGRAVRRRPVGRRGADDAGGGREGLADAPARAVDARRHRRDRAGDGRAGAGRSLARRARRPRSASRSAGWASRPSVQAAVLKRLDDEDPAVRQQLAASLGAMPPDERDGAVVSLLERHADDPIALDAALSGLRGSEADVLERLLAVGRSRRRSGMPPSRCSRPRSCAAARTRRSSSCSNGPPRRPAAVAAVGAAARGGGRAARRDDAGNAARASQRGCRRGAAVPDVSGRAGRAGRRLRVLETGRLRARGPAWRRWRQVGAAGEP